MLRVSRRLPNAAVALLLRQVLRMLVRGKRVYLVNGMRRSGNHAVIGWLASGAIGQRTDLVRSAESQRLLRSPCGKVAHINNVGEASLRLLADLYLKAIRGLPQGGVLIVSFEDQSCSNVDRSARIPAGRSCRLFIDRSTLNMAASRLERLRRSAENGRMPKQFNIDSSFLATIRANRNDRSCDWLRVSFDEWLDPDSSYRAVLAQQIGLVVNIDPGVSHIGGGSSFTGTTGRPSNADLRSRARQIHFSPTIARLMLSEGADLLEPWEIEILQAGSAELDQST